MTVYVIADIKVTDDSWVPDYAANVHDIVHKHGGKYLTRTGNITTVEGEGLDTTLVALIEFPSMEAVQDFASSEEYAPYGKARQEGSVSRLHVLDDTDLAGTIPYLPKGQHARFLVTSRLIVESVQQSANVVTVSTQDMSVRPHKSH